MADARGVRPSIVPLLMDRATFNAFADRAVAEDQPAEEPPGLLPDERDLFRHLAGSAQGRLEQELLPAEVVAEAVERWLAEG